MSDKAFSKVSLSELPPVACPCGTTKRAFLDEEDKLASIHYLTVSADARTHYHTRFTEIYTILEGEGFLELNGEMVPVKPLDTVMIRPGTRHRAIGKLVILNAAIPAFDAEDEHFD